MGCCGLRVGMDWTSACDYTQFQSQQCMPNDLPQETVRLVNSVEYLKIIYIYK